MTQPAPESRLAPGDAQFVVVPKRTTAEVAALVRGMPTVAPTTGRRRKRR